MEKELEEKLLLEQISKIVDEYHEVVNLEDTQPELFFSVKTFANSEGINYTHWLRNHNVFHVDTKRGQMPAKEMKALLIGFADEDKIIEKLKTKNSKLMDNLQTRAIFHKINAIDFVKQLTNCTLLRRGVNESEVLNIRLKNYSDDDKTVSYKKVLQSPIYSKIKQQAYKENLTIAQWFTKYSDYKYLGELASNKFSLIQLKDKSTEVLSEKNPEVYIQSVKNRLQTVATNHYITSLSDIRKIDKKLANSIRYLQQNYPTGSLDCWYNVVEKLELDHLILPNKNIDTNHNIPVKELEAKLNELLEISYPNRIVKNIKHNPKVHYLCKKLACYQHVTVKEILESKNYEFPLGFNTVKRLKSVTLVYKAKNNVHDINKDNLQKKLQENEQLLKKK